MDLTSVRDALVPVDVQTKCEAAVTAILRPGEGDVDVLLIVRKERVGDPWSGQVALPGGKAKRGERPLETAVREVREEVGLDLLRVATFLGCLPVRAPANRPEIAVIPHVAVLDRDVETTVGDEVAAVHWVPLLALSRTVRTVVRRLPNRDIQVPAFVHGDLEVWGMTHQVLREVVALMQPDRPPRLDSAGAPDSRPR